MNKMKIAERYPHATRLTMEIDAFRKQARTIEACIEHAESVAKGCTRQYGLHIGKSPVTKEDRLCDSIDYKDALGRTVDALKTLTQELSGYLDDFNSPSDALFMRMIYIYGTERGLVKSVSGLSTSGFYDRLYRCLSELEKLITDRRAA